MTRAHNDDTQRMSNLHLKAMNEETEQGKHTQRHTARNIGHHILIKNVPVHVGIHVSLNEPQLPSTSSSHAAPDHDATTTMLDCRQGTIFLVLLTRASPHMLDTIWVKQVYLRLIRPQDMCPVIHALGQVVFSKLFAGFFVSQLQKRLPSGMTAMQTDLLQCMAYGLSTDKLTFHFCNL